MFISDKLHSAKELVDADTAARTALFVTLCCYVCQKFKPQFNGNNVCKHTTSIFTTVLSMHGVIKCIYF